MFVRTPSQGQWSAMAFIPISTSVAFAAPCVFLSPRLHAPTAMTQRVLFSPTIYPLIEKADPCTARIM